MVVTVQRATLVFRYEDGVWKIAHRRKPDHLCTTVDHHPPDPGPWALVSITMT